MRMVTSSSRHSKKSFSLVGEKDFLELITNHQFNSAAVECGPSGLYEDNSSE